MSDAFLAWLPNRHFHIEFDPFLLYVSAPNFIYTFFTHRSHCIHRPRIDLVKEVTVGIANYCAIQECFPHGGHVDGGLIEKWRVFEGGIQLPVMTSRPTQTEAPSR